MRKLTVNKEGMSRMSKRTQQIKRVSPPAVPDTYRHSGSSFSSAGYSSSDDTAHFSSSRNKSALLDPMEHMNDGIYASNPASSNPHSSMSMQQSFLYHVQNNHPLTHKAAVYYHQQLALQEDQGIDLTQSPGRDSPSSSSSAGSGSRHSTVSLDSGRASSFHTAASSSSGGSKRIASGSSPGCYMADGLNSGIINSLRSSSISSCSIASGDNMRTDHEIITDWLRDLGFEEYASMFIEAGYDMPTISRMTPEDLTAIGIKKPKHREKIKQQIDSLQLPDNLPHYIPGSIEEWLQLLRLEIYIQPLIAQGYQTVCDVTQLPWEDMEDIGIIKLGHQKKLLLAIKRIKDILSGKWIAPGIASNNPLDYIASQSPSIKSHQKDQQSYYDQMYSMNTQSLSPMTAEQYYQQVGLSIPMSSPQQMHKEGDEIVLIKLRQPQRKSEVLDEQNQIHSVHSPSHYGYSQYRNDLSPDAICENPEDLYQMQSAMLNNRQWAKPVAMVKGNVCAQPIKAAVDKGGLKSAPEPPRRMCADQIDGKQSHPLNDLCQSYDAMMLSTQKAAKSQKDAYYEGGDCQMISVHSQQPIYANYITVLSAAGQQAEQHELDRKGGPSSIPLFNHIKTKAEVHVDKSQFTTNDSKSNSSIDSIDALPFANDNAGTIKQRASQYQQMHNVNLSQSDNNDIPKKLSASFEASSGGQSGECAMTYSTSSLQDNADLCIRNAGESNVLNDIGNMLANLTDELDAMLEEEKLIGLNDSE